MKFHVGQIVRCIDPGPSRTIREGGEYKISMVDDEYLRVEGIERSFYHFRFEPLIRSAILSEAYDESLEIDQATKIFNEVQSEMRKAR